MPVEYFSALQKLQLTSVDVLQARRFMFARNVQLLVLFSAGCQVRTVSETRLFRYH